MERSAFRWQMQDRETCILVEWWIMSHMFILRQRDFDPEVGQAASQVDAPYLPFTWQALVNVFMQKTYIFFSLHFYKPGNTLVKNLFLFVFSYHKMNIQISYCP
jgi:hypothetical protein